MPIAAKTKITVPKDIGAPPPREVAPLPQPQSPVHLDAALLMAETVERNGQAMDRLGETLGKITKKRNFTITVERDREGFIQRMRVTEE